jgi:hypothetical protein
MTPQMTISEEDIIERSEIPEYYSCPAPECICHQTRVRSCDWLQEVFDQLQAIADLPDNWDSYGAYRANEQILISARGLIQSLACVDGISKPHVNPTPDGGVQFEWESGRQYFEVEVVAERAACFLFRDDDLGIEEEGNVFVGESLHTVAEYILRINIHS